MATTPSSISEFLEPLVSCLTPDVAEKLANARADDDVQNRIDDLADRATEGLLTSAERQEYAGYLLVIDVITVLQASARAMLNNE